jgi:hypothetical protein
MKKQKHCDGFLGCRTPKHVETGIKTICNVHNREVSEVINYLCRIFIEDKDGVRTKFLNGASPVEEGL